MIDTGYLYAKDNKRIFVNTCLGCTGGCAYCYLKKMGYDNNSVVSEVKKAEELIAEIEKIGITQDILITLGCFSECWDDNNRSETIKIIKHFLQKGNQIQLATKRQISLEDASQFKELIKYYGQLVIFVSSATISKWDTIEKGTTHPKDRFKTFEISKQLPIPTVLYMKPVLKDITINDLELYKEVIKRCDISDVVVGSIFKETEKEEGSERPDNEETIHFSDKNELFYKPSVDQEETIIRNIMELPGVRVFSRSSHVMGVYKSLNKNMEDNDRYI